MGRMQIIKRGEGACNITGELNRIYKFQCILENAQLCSQYFTLLYPNDPQKVENVMVRGISTEEFVALLSDHFPANNLESMAEKCQEYSIAQRFNYIHEQTQKRLSLLISMNKESPDSDSTGNPEKQTARIQAIIPEPDTSETFDAHNIADNRPPY